MSDMNSQNPNNLIHSLKEPNLEEKTSLEQLNKILQELHKNILKDSNSKCEIKPIENNEKKEIFQNNEKKEEEKENAGKEKENNKKDIKEINKLDNKEEKEENSVNNEINENSDIINDNNLNQLKNLNDYKTSNDINIINNIGIKKKESNAIKEAIAIKENDENKKKTEIPPKNENNTNNNIEETNKKEDNNINNDNHNDNEDIRNKNKEYSYKEISQITESNIIPEELIAYNISQGSELFLNEVIDKLGGFEEDNSIKDNLNNTSNINDNIIKEIDSDSVKIDSKEDLKLCLTNIPITDEKSDTSQLTSVLNKACIRTNDNIRSKDFISNIDSSIPREEEKEEIGKDYRKISKKDTKNSNNINDDKKTIEMLFNQEPKKDESAFIEETKKEIYNEIDNMYEKKLNLVKINNKEKFSYITKYNDPDKEKVGYEFDYFYRNKNSIHFLNRRNNFLQQKYFSYILINNNINKNNKNNSDKDNEKKNKKNKNKDTKKDESNDSINNYEYKEEEINKFKKKYNEKFEKLPFNLNFIRTNTQHDNIKEHKIYDVEDMTSFYYYFNLYSPEEDFKKYLDDESEKEIVKLFTTYRKVLNDGNSFKRAFSYLLLETFILQNKIQKLDYIIYDIKKMLSKKFSDIKDICNILIDIKENSSIDYLMNSYNSQNCKLDEVMITYIEDTIKNAIGVENTKKYQEIDLNILRLLANVFDINLEIYYIEEYNDENNNKLLKMEKLVMLNDIFIQTKKNIKASSYSECESSTTFRLLYFLNSFYIVYTKKSDIDSTLANNNTEKYYYYVSTLPKYKCPNCKKCTGLDIIPTYEAIFCHICLTKYLQTILEKRAILFVKSNFSCIEYYTRPIKVTSDIIITFSLYKYITKNYITFDFAKIVERICFKCYEIFDKENINKLKCLCQLCDNCLEKLLKENIKDKVYLNKYELNTINKTKCLCENEVDLLNLMELSKNKPTEKDIRRAEERLIKELKKRCCLCKEKDPLKIFKIEITNGPQHYICLKCNDKLNNEENIQDIQNIEKKNEIKNDLSDYNSNDTAIKDKNVTKKIIDCQICFEKHIFIEDNNSENVNGTVPTFGGGKFKCCKGKCSIF